MTAPAPSPMRIAFVVQRYGREVNGGAEYHCRALAEHLAARAEVETVTVFTTCARDYETWANHYVPGVEQLSGVRVERFPTTILRKPVAQGALGLALRAGVSLPVIERAWLFNQGPATPALLDRLRQVKDDHDAFIFFTYLYYPTVLGLDCVPSRRILVPTAHDEPPIYFKLFRDVFETPEALAFNTEEERDFTLTRFRIPEERIRTIGCGIDIPDEPATPTRPRSKPFLLYLGRIARNKGVPNMVHHFIEFKRRHAEAEFQSTTGSYRGRDLELVVAGSGKRTLLPNRKDVVCEGFVSDERKRELLAAAAVLLMPSRYESLSLATLEAWTRRTPVLVDGACAVTAGHVARSRGGVAYRNVDEFCQDLFALLGDREKRKTMGERGWAYVKDRYDWPRVEDEFLALIRKVAQGGRPDQPGRK